MTERATWLIPRALKRIISLVYKTCTQVATIIAVEEVWKRRFWQDNCFKIGQGLAVFETYVKILLGSFGIRLKWPDIWQPQKMWSCNNLLTDEQTAVHCLASGSGLNEMYNCVSSVFAHTSGRCFPSTLNSSLTYISKKKAARVRNLVAHHRWNQCVLGRLFVLVTLCSCLPHTGNPCLSPVTCNWWPVIFNCGPAIFFAGFVLRWKLN